MCDVARVVLIPPFFADTEGGMRGEGEAPASYSFRKVASLYVVCAAPSSDEASESLQREESLVLPVLLLGLPPPPEPNHLCVPLRRGQPERRSERRVKGL